MGFCFVDTLGKRDKTEGLWSIATKGRSELSGGARSYDKAIDRSRKVLGKSLSQLLTALLLGQTVV